MNENKISTQGKTYKKVNHKVAKENGYENAIWAINFIE